MPISNVDHRYVEDFFSTAAKCLTDGRNDAVVSYLAEIRGSDIVVIAARITLGAAVPASTIPSEVLASGVVAGKFHLSEVELDLRAFLNYLLSNSVLKTPRRDLRFPGGNNGLHGTWLSALDERGLHSKRRFSVLKVFGGAHAVANRSALDWELKAARMSFESISDLADEFGFSIPDGQTISFEVVAENILQVDEESTFADHRASIFLTARAVLDIAEVSLRVRVKSRGKVVSRRSFGHDQCEWDVDAAGQQRATFSFEVPEGAILDCTAVYAELAQHERVVANQTAFENPLRLAYEAFDAQFIALRALLESGAAKRDDARGVEAAIAWTLTMLGFQVLHLGNLPQNQNAPDVVARSPDGNFLVIECTTGVLKGDKLSNLSARAAAVRTALEDIEGRGVGVIAVMLTTMSEADVRFALEETERSGIVVICREQIDEWLELTAAVPDANGIVARQMDRLAEVQLSPSRPS